MAEGAFYVTMHDPENRHHFREYHVWQEDPRYPGATWLFQSRSLGLAMKRIRYRNLEAPIYQIMPTTGNLYQVIGTPESHILKHVQNAGG